MKFDLFFSGKPPSANKRLHRNLKQRFRSELHSQMDALWHSKPLSEHSRWLRKPVNEVGDGWAYVQRNGKEYVALVHARSSLAAHLKFVFYEPSGGLGVSKHVTDGDNRIKPLIDLLRVPDDPNIFPDDDNCQHCLLEDDALVWNIQVERARLLRPIESGDYLTRIEVRIVPSRVTTGNLGLFGTVVH